MTEEKKKRIDSTAVLRASKDVQEVLLRAKEIQDAMIQPIQDAMRGSVAMKEMQEAIRRSTIGIPVSYTHLTLPTKRIV